jgi:hypothetical protein
MAHPTTGGLTVPSQRKQMNIRLDAETEERVARLVPLVSAAVGLNVSMADLVRLGMIELERKYAPADAPKGKGGKK